MKILTRTGQIAAFVVIWPLGLAFGYLFWPVVYWFLPGYGNETVRDALLYGMNVAVNVLVQSATAFPLAALALLVAYCLIAARHAGRIGKP